MKEDKLEVQNQANFLIQLMKVSKAKKKTSIEELENAIDCIKQLDNLNQTSIYLALLADLLILNYDQYESQLRKFIFDLCFIPKAFKIKKNDENEDEVKRKKRKPKVRNGDVDDIDLQKLSQESINNPNNIEQPTSLLMRQSILPNPLNPQLQPLRQAKDEPNMFENQVDGTFLNQVSKIDEAMRRQQEKNQIESENSNTNSSNSSRFNKIKNLEQKFKILGGDLSFEGNLKALVRRKPRRQTTTKVKKSQQVFHEKIVLDLDETRNTYDPNLTLDRIHKVNNQEQFIYKKFNKDFQKTTNFFSSMIQSFTLYDQLKKVCKQNRFKNPMHNFESFNNPQTTDFPTIDEDYNNYTNQFSYLNTQSLFAETSLENRIIQNKGELVLRQLSIEAKKPEALIFFEMLTACTKGEIIMQQQKPQEFGPIKLKLIRHFE